MGQRQTGIALCNDTGVAPRSLQATRKKRKTLTLKKQPLNKQPQKPQPHGGASDDGHVSAVHVTASKSAVSVLFLY